jgi:hypothetical protein
MDSAPYTWLRINCYRNFSFSRPRLSHSRPSGLKNTDNNWKSSGLGRKHYSTSRHMCSIIGLEMPSSVKNAEKEAKRKTYLLIEWVQCIKWVDNAVSEVKQICCINCLYKDADWNFTGYVALWLGQSTSAWRLNDSLSRTFNATRVSYQQHTLPLSRPAVSTVSAFCLSGP